MENNTAINTVNDLRLILAEEIEKIRSGNTTAANVNAIVNATGKILTTVKMEIEYNKLIGRTPLIPFITGKVDAVEQLPAVSEAA
jgi:hypothetical protein